MPTPPDALAAFNETIRHLAPEIPEIARHLEEIAGGAARLMARQPEIGANPDIFTDPSVALIFGAIALSEHQRTAGQGADAQLHDAAAGLLVLPALPVDNATAYRAFENPEAGRRLVKAIQHDRILDAFRRRNGVGPGETPRYTLHVLDISAKQAEIDTEALEYNRQELEQRVGHRLGRAWVTSSNGQRHMYIPLPIAELACSPGQPGSRRTILRAQAMNTIEHEEAHIHKCFTTGCVGRGINEISAEAALTEPGLSYTYTDGRLFGGRDLPLLSGMSIQEHARKHGIRRFDMYAALTKAAGLRSMLEIALTIPDTLVHLGKMTDGERIVRSKLGNYDTLAKRIYRRASPSRQAAIEQRIAELTRGEGPLTETKLPFGVEEVNSFMSDKIARAQRNDTYVRAFMDLAGLELPEQPQDDITATLIQVNGQLRDTEAIVQDIFRATGQALAGLRAAWDGTTSEDALQTLGCIEEGITCLEALVAGLASGNTDLESYLQSLSKHS